MVAGKNYEGGTERKKTSSMNSKDLAELMAGMRPGKGKEVRLSLILHQRDRNPLVFQ